MVDWPSTALLCQSSQLETVDGYQRADEAAGRQHAAVVLVVDDNKDYRDRMVSQLEAHSMDVVVAYSGEEAMEAFEYGADQIGCMVIDRIMPGLNGMEATLQLRRKFPTLPVVMVSTSWTDALQREALSLGVTACLEKPISEQALVQSVERAIIQWQRDVSLGVNE